MKFGKHLNEKKVVAWSFYYLDYNSIKKLIIRKVATSTVELQQREQNFAEILEKELQKINSFHSLKASELIHACKSIKLDIADQLKEGFSVIDFNTWHRDTFARLDTITKELIHYDDYKNVNVDAFVKLLKKHDKHQQSQLRGFWVIRLNKESFVQNHPTIIDRLLLKLSKSYFTLNQAQQQNNDSMQTKATEIKVAQGQVFERSTTKYWVPNDKVLAVKTEVMRNLPISSFNKKSSSLITSVYYDSEDLKLYHDRLRKEEGAQCIRMRTYNEPPQSTVFVERKVHHDSWVTEKSVKSRFPIKEKNLMKYLRGDPIMQEKLAKMKEANNISEKEYNSTLTLANEIQSAVMDRKLQPTMTSRYERTAFQLEGNARVRVSLDTRLDLITEFGYRDNKWGRDLSNEAMIMDSEICHFPHAVLEIKLSLEMGEEKPKWVQDLLNKDCIIACGKFSKFIHGCAVLLPRKVTLLPCWFPQLEETSDFRASDRITRVTSREYTKSRSTLLSQSEIKIDIPKSPSTRKKNSTANEVELVTMKGKETNIPEPKPMSNNSNAHRSVSEKVGNYIPFLKKMKTGRKKKVQAPIKIEPKTFFANERTFIQWLSFLILIQGIGFGLMGLGTSLWLRIGGISFVIIALIFMIYAIVLFLVRRHKIANRERGPYDERLGPILIVGLLMIGLIITIILYAINFAETCKGLPILDGGFFHYHPSEVIWHSKRNELVFVGPDMLTYVNSKNVATDYVVAGDLEGLTEVPSRPGYLYIGTEYPGSILEFDETSLQVTRNIPTPIPLASMTMGMEGLAFVPMAGFPSGGVFWAGSQMDGKIYVYQVDLEDPESTATMIDSFSPVPNLSHISSLNYHTESGLVFGVIARKWAFAINPVDRVIKGSWPLGVPNPEGFALRGSNVAYLACDACEEIWQFKFSWTTGIVSGKCTSTSQSQAAADDYASSQNTGSTTVKTTI